MWSRKKYAECMDAKKYIEHSLDDIWKELANHKFNAFPQREYTKEEMSDIEKRLLQKSLGRE